MWVRTYNANHPDRPQYAPLERFDSVSVVANTDNTWSVQGSWMNETGNSSSAVLWPGPYTTQAEADTAVAKLYGTVGAVDLST